MTSNTSGLVPVGRAVLVQHYTQERKESAIILMEDTKERDQMIEQRAVVIAVGPSAWRDEDQPRAVPGQKVLISKYAGYLAKGTLDGKPYRFINDRDIFAVIEDEGNDDER